MKKLNALTLKKYALIAAGFIGATWTIWFVWDIYSRRGADRVDGTYLVEGGQAFVTLKADWRNHLHVIDHSLIYPEYYKHREGMLLPPNMDFSYFDGVLCITLKYKIPEFPQLFGKLNPQCIVYMELTPSDETKRDWDLDLRAEGYVWSIIAWISSLDIEKIMFWKKSTASSDSYEELLPRNIGPYTLPIKSYLHRMDDPEVIQLYDRKLRTDPAGNLEKTNDLLASYPGDPFLEVRRISHWVELGDMEKGELGIKLWRKAHASDQYPFLRAIIVCTQLRIDRSRFERQYPSLIERPKSFFRYREEKDWFKEDFENVWDDSFANMEAFLVEIGKTEGHYAWIMRYFNQPVFDLDHTRYVNGTENLFVPDSDEMTPELNARWRCEIAAGLQRDRLPIYKGLLRFCQILMAGRHPRAYSDYTNNFFWDMFDTLEYEIIYGCENAEKSVAFQAMLTDIVNLHKPLSIDEASEICFYSFLGSMSSCSDESLEALFCVEKTFLAHLQTLRVVAAVKAFYFENARFPILTKELEPYFSGTLPKDPFSTGTLQLRTVDGQCCVYSFGPDSDDDKAASESDPNNYRDYGKANDGDISVSLSGDAITTQSLQGLRSQNVEDILRRFPKGLPIDPFNSKKKSNYLNDISYAPLCIVDRGTTAPLMILSYGPDNTDPRWLWRRKDYSEIMEFESDKMSGAYNKEAKYVEDPSLPDCVKLTPADYGFEDYANPNQIIYRVNPMMTTKPYDPDNGNDSPGDIYVEIPLTPKTGTPGGAD